MNISRIRYYNVPPDGKTLDQCASHGADHAGYGWGPMIDPRWSDGQVTAYMTAFNETQSKNS
jgi:hypothetical protein